MSSVDFQAGKKGKTDISEAMKIGTTTHDSTTFFEMPGEIRREDIKATHFLQHM